MNNFYQLVQQRVESRSNNNQNSIKKTKNKKLSKLKKKMSGVINKSFEFESVDSTISSDYAA